MVFFMDRSFERWEMALLIGVLLTMLTGAWVGKEQEELADTMVRLHVVANSDTPKDQMMKLEVRDRVLEEAESLYPSDITRAEALEILSAHLTQLEQAGQSVVEEWGEDDVVTAELKKCWFPTKEYGEFSLPSGEYTALRVVIGEGAGQNWWCVAFPPLCLGAASETMEQVVEAGKFTDAQSRLMTKENEGYVLKFKSMELLGQLKGLFVR